MCFSLLAICWLPLLHLEAVWVIFPKYRFNHVIIYLRASAMGGSPNCLAWHTQIDLYAISTPPLTPHCVLHLGIPLLLCQPWANITGCEIVSMNFREKGLDWNLGLDITSSITFNELLIFSKFQSSHLIKDNCAFLIILWWEFIFHLTNMYWSICYGPGYLSMHLRYLCEQNRWGSLLLGNLKFSNGRQLRNKMHNSKLYGVLEGDRCYGKK